MPTTNPVPSQDPSDLLFNASKLDEVLNGTGNSFTDRLGVARRTVAGMNSDFDAQLADAESDLNVYRADAAASAAEALGYLQTIRATSYGAYASDPATDPLGNPPNVGDEYFNTTSNLLKRFNGTTWQASDINTANLAAPSGSSLIGYDTGTVQDVLDAVTGSTGAASVGYTPAGTGALATTVQSKLRETVSVKDFGAVGDWNGTTGTNDSAAFQLAINSSGVVDLVPGKNYLLSSAVTVTSHRIINGNGATITVGTNAAFNPTAPIEIYNVNFQSTSSGTSKGLAVNAQANALDGTVIQGCKFGRVQIALFDSNVSDATANNSRIRILNNTFTGNYTGVPSVDVNNVVSVRGAVDIFIDGNSFDVVGIERFIKLSDSCRRVFIRGNSFKCLTTTVGKQAIDLFADTREVVVADNIADLSGFTAFVENKNGDNNVDYAEPSEMLVNGNIIKMAGAITTMSPIAIYGTWGLTEQTLDICIAKVFGNKILQAGTGATSATIVVRGMTHADVTGNTLWRDDNPDYAGGIEVSNCKREIVVGNQIEHGNILVNLNAQHPGGTAYANPPLDVLIANNQIISFGALDGVYISGSGKTTDRVVINGNSFYPKSGTSSSGVIWVAGATITDLSVLSNYGKSLTTAGVVVTNSGSITETRISGNSWQGGRTTSTPGTIISGGNYTINITVPGVEVGDSLQIGLPYDMQGANVEARVSASNNVRILIRNQTAGSLTFASGTFSARVARG